MKLETKQSLLCLLFFFLIFLNLKALDNLILIDSLKTEFSLPVETFQNIPLFSTYSNIMDIRLYQTESGKTAEIITMTDGKFVRHIIRLSEADYRFICKTYHQDKPAVNISIPVVTDSLPGKFIDEEFTNGRWNLIGGYSTLGAVYYNWASVVAMDIQSPGAAVGTSLIITGGLPLVMTLNTKEAHIRMADAKLSLAMARRGIIHGFLMGNAFSTDNPQLMFTLSLISSGVNGALWYDYSKRNNLSLGKAIGLVTYHDFFMSQACYLDYYLIKHESRNLDSFLDNDHKDVIRMTAALLPVAGGTFGIFAGKSLVDEYQYSSGDGLNTQTILRVGATTGQALAKGFGLSPDFQIGCAALGQTLAFFKGNQQAKAHNLSLDDGNLIYYISHGAYLLGIGLNAIVDFDHLNENWMYCGAAGFAIGYWSSYQMVLNNPNHSIINESSQKFSFNCLPYYQPDKTAGLNFSFEF